MKLNQLFDTNLDIEISTLATDSRAVKPNSIFFCIDGFSVDRHDFVDAAIEKGAVAIVHKRELAHKEGIFYVQVDDVNQELERVVALFYGEPSKKLEVYGVTGTNGKSTISSTLRHVLNRLKVNTGYVGTISIEYNEVILEPSLTTPDIIEMNDILKNMVDQEVEAVSLEISSQGLDMNRVDTLAIDVAGFTNLSLEHLDYHKTMENYFLAKKHLFDLLSDNSKMVINIDDAYGQRLYNLMTHPHKYSIAIDKEADYRAQDIVLGAKETRYNLMYQGQIYPVSTNMVAKFNVYNSLQVIAMLHVQGYDLKTIINNMKDLPLVKGRTNFIDASQDFNAVVDYSHTPDGFEKIYTYLKGITQGRLICVYGNAGGRDHSKRPIMGEISDQFCDLIVITEQDRRNENIYEIKEEMVQNIKNTPYVFYEKRYDAIEYALKEAQKGDTVVVLGKGDERFQHGPQGLEAWPGDDKVVLEILKKLSL